MSFWVLTVGCLCWCFIFMCSAYIRHILFVCRDQVFNKFLHIKKNVENWWKDIWHVMSWRSKTSLMTCHAFLHMRQCHVENRWKDIWQMFDKIMFLFFMFHKFYYDFFYTWRKLRTLPFDGQDTIETWYDMKLDKYNIWYKHDNY